MSTIALPYKSNDPTIMMMKEPPKNCFLRGDDPHRGKLAASAIVHWHGRESEVCLHPVCAELLGLPLIQNARTANEITRLRVRLRPEGEIRPSIS